VSAITNISVEAFFYFPKTHYIIFQSVRRTFKLLYKIYLQKHQYLTMLCDSPAACEHSAIQEMEQELKELENKELELARRHQKTVQTLDMVLGEYEDKSHQLKTKRMVYEKKVRELEIIKAELAEKEREVSRVLADFEETEEDVSRVLADCEEQEHRVKEFEEQRTSNQNMMKQIQQKIHELREQAQTATPWSPPSLDFGLSVDGVLDALMIEAEDREQIGRFFGTTTTTTTSGAPQVAN